MTDTKKGRHCEAGGNLKAHALSDGCKIAFPKGRDRLSAEKAFS